MVFRYSNRKGRHYYLHQRRTQKGESRYVFAREVGDGALDQIPDGYEVRENVNGIVSIGKTRSRLITEQEEKAVTSTMAVLGLDEYRLEVHGQLLLIFEPDRRRADHATERDDYAMSRPPALPSRLWLKRVRFEPVLRFVLDDRRARVFHVERMTYRGHGGWSRSLARGRILQLAEEYLPHLGRESFFDL